MSHFKTMDHDAEILAELLDNSINRQLENTTVAVAFSGGLDSSLIALLLKNKCKCVLYTIGLNNAHDLKIAPVSACSIGLETNNIIITDQDVNSAVSNLVTITGLIDPIRIAIELPLYFVAKECKETIIYSGQGADELFGGYNKYLGMDELKLTRSIENDLASLLGKYILIDKITASLFKKKVIFPFLDDELIRYAMALPIQKKVSNGERKIILRQTAKILDLPNTIINSRKKAAQYSSGVMKSIERLAKKDNRTIKSYVEKYKTK